MIKLNIQKANVTKAAKTVLDETVSVGTKAADFSSHTATTAADKAKAIYAQTKELASTGIDKVTDVKVGNKNVGERASATVDSVQSAVDVEKISGQVAKLRDQIEGALGSWKDSFRPSGDQVKASKASTATKPASKPAAKPAAKATASKPAAKPAAKATASKPAAKKTTAKPVAKATASKPAAKKTAPKAAAKR